MMAFEELEELKSDLAYGRHLGEDEAAMLIKEIEDQRELLFNYKALIETTTEGKTMTPTLLSIIEGDGVELEEILV